MPSIRTISLPGMSTAGPLPCPWRFRGPACTARTNPVRIHRSNVRDEIDNSRAASRRLTAGGIRSTSSIYNQGSSINIVCKLFVRLPQSATAINFAPEFRTFPL